MERPGVGDVKRRDDWKRCGGGIVDSRGLDFADRDGSKVELMLRDMTRRGL